MITNQALVEARDDGGGFCFFCFERADDLPSPYCSHCESCGHRTVLPAATILDFIAQLDLEGDAEG